MVILGYRRVFVKMKVHTMGTVHSIPSLDDWFVRSVLRQRMNLRLLRAKTSEVSKTSEVFRLLDHTSYSIPPEASTSTLTYAFKHSPN